jgi:hypothetical protein
MYSRLSNSRGIQAQNTLITNTENLYQIKSIKFNCPCSKAADGQANKSTTWPHKPNQNQKPNEKASRVRETHTNITEFGQLETVECLTEQLMTLAGT